MKLRNSRFVHTVMALGIINVVSSLCTTFLSSCEFYIDKPIVQFPTEDKLPIGIPYYFSLKNIDQNPNDELSIKLLPPEGKGTIFMAFNREPTVKDFDYSLPFSRSNGDETITVIIPRNRSTLLIREGTENAAEELPTAIYGLILLYEDTLIHASFLQSKTRKPSTRPAIGPSIRPAKKSKPSHHPTSQNNYYFDDGAPSEYDDEYENDDEHNEPAHTPTHQPTTAPMGSSPTPISPVPAVTTVLTTGVPVQGTSNSSSGYQYYKYTLMKDHTDVVFALTVLSGDPDMFVSEPPVTQPTRYNYTFMSLNLGADTITIQADDPKKRCTPKPSQNKYCDFYVGVSGWSRTAVFSIVAKLDSSYYDTSTTIHLKEGRPQTSTVEIGRYAYFFYKVPANTVEATTIISVTPSGHTDVDLYVALTGEPGKDHYDYDSTQWGSAVDQVSLTCSGCDLNIGVYGYKAGEFTITAATTGLIQMQPGRAVVGIVDKKAYRYYTLHNDDQFGEISFILSVISGDADIYVNPRLFNTTANLPTTASYTWRSVKVGSDSVYIDYQKDIGKYCYNCDYVVGVYGYKNTSYSLLGKDSHDTIIKLANNHVQTMTIPTANTIQYFSAYTTTSADDILITITPLNTGTADIYVQAYNTTYYNSQTASGKLVLPNPNNASSYIANSADGINRNYVLVPGPHVAMTVFAVAVYSHSPIKFTILARTQQSPVILQSGVPQNHFVSANTMEYFEFVPTEKENVKIAVTARTGDPDLYVNTGPNAPYCPPSQSGNPYVFCSNTTWISRSYATDQILISKDSPCLPMFSSTIISKSCDPTTVFLPGTGQRVIIGVLGYSDSQFTITVSSSGITNTLVTGQPQLSVAEPNLVCNYRSLASETCLTNAYNQVIKTVLLASFSFRVVKATEGSTVGDTLFTLFPQCTSADSILDCTPGCPCQPLSIYVNACPASKCTMYDRYPSNLIGGSHYNLTAVSSHGGHIWVESSYTMEVPSFGGKCDPSLANEDCLYYASVIAPYRSPTIFSTGAVKAEFTLTARNELDTVFIPCASSNPSDGIIYSALHSLSPHLSSSQRYEMCASSSAPSSVTEKLTVSLEQCSNDPGSTVYACADDDHCKEVLPSTSNWAYFSDSTYSCAMVWGRKPSGGYDWIKKNCVPSQGTPFLKLDQRSYSNYFLLVNGTGDYQLRVSRTTSGIDTAPILSTLKSPGQSKVVLDKGHVSLSWDEAKITYPGGSPLSAPGIVYKLYAVNVQSYKTNNCAARLSTNCGLQASVTECPTVARTVLLPSDYTISKGVISVSVTANAFQLNTYLNLTMVASCDSFCQNQASKQLGGTAYPYCESGHTCDTQSYVYSSSYLFVDSSSADSGSGGSASSSGASWISSILTTVGIITSIVIFIGVMVAMYWFKFNDSSKSGDVLVGIPTVGMQMKDFPSPSFGVFNSSHTTVHMTPVRVNNEDHDFEPVAATNGGYTPPSINLAGEQSTSASQNLMVKNVGLAFNSFRDAAVKVTEKVKKATGNLSSQDAGALTIVSSTVYTPLAEKMLTDEDDEEEVRL